MTLHHFLFSFVARNFPHKAQNQANPTMPCAHQEQPATPGMGRVVLVDKSDTSRRIVPGFPGTEKKRWCA